MTVKIFIDAGHGGKDAGAVGNGLREKDLTLSIAQRVSSLLTQYNGVSVKLSRNDDRFIELVDRARMANAWGADYFVSIHINAGGGTGYEDFIYNGNVSQATIDRQAIMNDEIANAIGLRNRGRKRANLAVLRHSNMPAILTEIGFIDNVADASKLKDRDFIEKAAQGHVNGIARIFGLKRKETAKGKATSEPSAWAKKSWGKATVAGVVDGTNPQGALTREQFAVILDRLGLVKE